MYLVLDGRAGDPTVVVLWRDVQVKGIGLVCLLSAELRWFETVCGLEWYCSLFKSAMYAGVFTFDRVHFCYCEGPPCTSLVFMSVWIGLLIGFSNSSRSMWPSFWTKA